MAAGMINILSPNVGSGATYQPVIGSSSGNSLRDIVKNSSTTDLVKSFQLQVNAAIKHLSKARENLLRTERAALRQEIREIEAVLEKGDFTVKVKDLPNTRWFGQKWKNDLVREAKNELNQYHSNIVPLHTLTKEELKLRGVDITNLSTYTPTETEQQEIEKFFEDLAKSNGNTTDQGSNLLEGLNGEIRAIETATGVNRWVLFVGILTVFIYLKKRKKRK